MISKKKYIHTYMYM